MMAGSEADQAMSATGDDRTALSAVRERDFYRRLLDLGGQDELEPLLDQALALIVSVTGATTAYLELYDDTTAALSAPPREPLFWRGHCCSPADLAVIRASISRGIIARAIGDGRTVETASAQGDPRFEDLGSVRRNAIDAVLCAPVGTSPPIGVVYLQGRGPFSPDDRQRAELFARQLAPLADRLFARRPGHDVVDHTRDIRLRFHAPGVVGRSRALARVLHDASLVAPLDIDVLITGPSGTGKSALAAAIVANSERARGPFVPLNCAAIPESLIESELFGAERGAHSAATKKMTGKVAAAEGGTLFLDEVGELTPGAQAKLLQLLQSREYHPLGATSAVRADVRILSATNADLRAKVSARQFRDDLYYRLHVMPIALPGLAERRDDIGELVEHFCAEACRRHKLAVMTVARRTLFACREAPWPGNVRQLANAIEAAVIRARGEQSATLLEHHVFPELARPDGEKSADTQLSFQEATRRFQRRFLLECLEHNDWNVAETARQLDLARSHLYNLIHGLALQRTSAGAASSS
jgi:Nif-specific regulatory protein